jgi:hypothetical protein
VYGWSRTCVSCCGGRPWSGWRRRRPTQSGAQCRGGGCQWRGIAGSRLTGGIRRTGWPGVGPPLAAAEPASAHRDCASVRPTRVQAVAAASGFGPTSASERRPTAAWIQVGSAMRCRLPELEGLPVSGGRRGRAAPDRASRRRTRTPAAGRTRSRSSNRNRAAGGGLPAPGPRGCGAGRAASGWRRDRHSSGSARASRPAGRDRMTFRRLVGNADAQVAPPWGWGAWRAHRSGMAGGPAGVGGASRAAGDAAAAGELLRAGPHGAVSRPTGAGRVGVGCEDRVSRARARCCYRGVFNEEPSP